MMQFNNPIPIIIKETGQEGYAIYVESSGIWYRDWET